MIELLKDLLGINELDESKDTVLNFYIDLARESIQSYLCYKVEDMEGKFQIQTINLAKFLYENKDVVGTIQRSEGSTSMTIERGLPKFIQASLPLPKVRVVG